MGFSVCVPVICMFPSPQKNHTVGIYLWSSAFNKPETIWAMNSNDTKIHAHMYTTPFLSLFLYSQRVCSQAYNLLLFYFFFSPWWKCGVDGSCLLIKDGSSWFFFQIDTNEKIPLSFSFNPYQLTLWILPWPISSKIIEQLCVSSSSWHRIKEKGIQ